MDIDKKLTDIEEALARVEETQLAKVRNVGLDLVGIMHMKHSYENGEKEWTCQCPACQYVRTDVRIVDSFAKAVVGFCKKDIIN